MDWWGGNEVRAVGGSVGRWVGRSMSTQSIECRDRSTQHPARIPSQSLTHFEQTKPRKETNHPTRTERLLDEGLTARGALRTHDHICDCRACVYVCVFWGGGWRWSVGREDDNTQRVWTPPQREETHHRDGRRAQRAGRRRRTQGSRGARARAWFCLGGMGGGFLCVRVSWGVWWSVWFELLKEPTTTRWPAARSAALLRMTLPVRCCGGPLRPRIASSNRKVRTKTPPRLGGGGRVICLLRGGAVGHVQTLPTALDRTAKQGAAGMCQSPPAAAVPIKAA